MTPKIFLSYCWANITIVDIIDNDFQNMGIILTRDIRDAQYRKSLKDFMKTINSADFVIMLIGDDFLKSESCMYEVMELLNSEIFEKRILPVRIGPSFFKMKTSYYDYWDQKIQECIDNLAKYTSADYIQQLEHQRNIRINLPKFFNKLADLKLIDFESLKKENYKPITDILRLFNAKLLAKINAIDKLKDFDNKEVAFEMLLNEYGPDYLIYFIRGKHNKVEGKFKSARVYYEKAIQLSPRSANVYNDLAVLLETHFGEKDEARQLYEKVLNINPTFEASILNYGILLDIHYKDYVNARKVWDHAIKVNPNNKKFHLNFAALLTDHFEEYEKALEHYQNALALDPSYLKGLTAIARLLEHKLKRPEDALSYYQSVMQHNPDEADILEVSEYYGRIGNIALLSKSLYSALIRQLPAEISGGYALLAEDILKDYPTAQRFYQIAFATGSADPKLHNRYGVFAEYKIMEYQLAKKYYLKAIKLNPARAMYHYNYAYICEVQFNDYQKARKHYQKSIAIDPSWMDAYVNLAYLQITKFGGADALQNIRTAINLNPGLRLCYSQLGLLAETDEKQIPQILNLLRDSLKQNTENKLARELVWHIIKLYPAQSKGKLNGIPMINPEHLELEEACHLTDWLLEGENYTESVELLKHFTSSGKDNERWLSSYSSSLIMDYKFEEALPILEKLLKLKPNIASFHYNYAVALSHVNQSEKSRFHLDKALAMGLKGQCPDLPTDFILR